MWNFVRRQTSRRIPDTELVDDAMVMSNSKDSTIALNNAIMSHLMENGGVECKNIPGGVCEMNVVSSAASPPRSVETAAAEDCQDPGCSLKDQKACEGMAKIHKVRTDFFVVVVVVVVVMLIYSSYSAHLRFQPQLFAIQHAYNRQSTCHRL